MRLDMTCNELPGNLYFFATRSGGKFSSGRHSSGAAAGAAASAGPTIFRFIFNWSANTTRTTWRVSMEGRAVSPLFILPAH